MVNNFMIDKEMVKNTLADLTQNYKVIESEIVAKTQLERDQQQSRYQKVMELIDSLKLSLKTEVNNRKETEDQFMKQVDANTQDILNELTLKYLNQMYVMREKLTQFGQRKARISEKLEKLQYMVDTNLQK